MDVKDAVVAAWDSVVGWSKDAWEKVSSGGGGGRMATLLPQLKSCSLTSQLLLPSSLRAQTKTAFTDAKTWVECTAVDWVSGLGQGGARRRPTAACRRSPSRAHSDVLPPSPSLFFQTVFDMEPCYEVC